MGELAFVSVQCDLSLSTSLQELSNMVDVLCWVAVVDHDVVDNAAVTCESGKSVIHPAVVMFGYGGNSVGCAEVLEPAKGCDKGG